MKTKIRTNDAPETLDFSTRLHLVLSGNVDIRYAGNDIDIHFGDFVNRNYIAIPRKLVRSMRAETVTEPGIAAEQTTKEKLVALLGDDGAIQVMGNEL